MANSVHIMLQGKGGVGKSTLAGFLAQYYKSKSDNVLCIDTDPVNTTFASFPALDARTINFLTEEKQIDPREFDKLVDMILEHDGDVVVDNGASSFVPLASYMAENELVEVLTEAGKKVFIHVPLAGADLFEVTLTGLNAILESQTAPVVVWENAFRGPVERDGKIFEGSKLHDKYKDRVAGIVRVEIKNPDLHGQDMTTMLKNRLTFDEALQSDDFGTMPRSRLKSMRKAIFDQLEALHLGE